MSRVLLLADDSLAIQRVVGLTFEQSDFELVVTSNGDEALAELARCEPAVVLADVHMPGASGYDVARSVKDGSPDTPVLLLVGTFEAFDEERARASGADGHLLKPFDSLELLQRVDTLAPAPRRAEETARPEEVASDPTRSESRQPDESEPTAAASEPEAAAPEAPALAEPVAADGPTEGPSEDAEPEVESSEVPGTAGAHALADEEIERIARRVIELMSVDTVREVARDVVPRIAEEVVRQRIEELERDVE